MSFSEVTKYEQPTTNHLSPLWQVDKCREPIGERDNQEEVRAIPEERQTGSRGEEGRQADQRKLSPPNPPASTCGEGESQATITPITLTNADTQRIIGIVARRLRRRNHRIDMQECMSIAGMGVAAAMLSTPPNEQLLIYRSYCRAIDELMRSGLAGRMRGDRYCPPRSVSTVSMADQSGPTMRTTSDLSHDPTFAVEATDLIQVIMGAAWLSDHKKTIMRHMCSGLDRTETAKVMGLSYRTVSNGWRTGLEEARKRVAAFAV